MAIAFTRPAAAQAVRGTAVDAGTGEPIVAATIVAVDTLGEERTITATAADGGFRLRLPEAGRYRLRAERLGYADALSDPLTVGSGEIAVVELRVSAEPIELDPLTAVVEREVRDARLDAWGFYDRRERFGEKSGFGRFLDREDIERKMPTDVSDVLRGVPGVRVVGAGGRRREIRTRTYGFTCSPAIYIDGVRFPLMGQTIDDILPTAVDLVAVEVYPGLVGPIRYRKSNDCATILLWTGFAAEEER